MIDGGIWELVDPIIVLFLEESLAILSFPYFYFKVEKGFQHISLHPSGIFSWTYMEFANQPEENLHFNAVFSLLNML